MLVAGVASVTNRHAENSEVLPLGSVAVATTRLPLGASSPKPSIKLTLPVLSVVTLVRPKKRSPSPCPDTSHALVLKNSS